MSLLANSGLKSSIGNSRRAGGLSSDIQTHRLTPRLPVSGKHTQACMRVGCCPPMHVTRQASTYSSHLHMFVQYFTCAYGSMHDCIVIFVNLREQVDARTRCF
jgi:hypothetical protein